ncbi:MAG: polyhydroxyalkanoate synthesis repressor PhaR [Gammaproteobacteria bacterium]|nr:polyhydroxyalkanoate synthesis repressor PhaR [Gammaproteobacteria bacterium]
MHELKKYPNRRLYNTTESRYVTIEDVRKLIVAGESIHVVDGKGGEDITRSVLLQILAEQETEGHESVLTNRVIENLIRFYGDRMGGVVGRYIEQSIVAFLDHQDQWRTHLRQINEMNPLNLMRQAFEPRWPGQPPPRPDRSSEEVDEPESGDDKSR